ncbi:MAG: hypothetical protein KF789_05560, partial [Bdellovibrionaceae bacterium]|nr:hypothetical protein [Pseudobdellovibrionaceae bacterium]
MSSIDYFFSCFVSLDRNNPPEISTIEANEFSVDVTVLNVSLSTQGLQSLRNYFGDVPVSSKQLEGRHGVLLSISRVKVPDQLYSVLSILKYIQANQQQGLFMGIGEFGPLFLPFEDLTHAQMYGASGFGKSSFFRFLLSQTLAFHKDVMNYIIDPKQIDYRAFQDHPQVGRIATNRDEWYSLLGALLIEMAAREYTYSEAFSTPPTSLKEYRQFKADLKRSDLPDYPRILLWIDEAHMISEYHNEDLGNHLSLLLKKGRAFGIHVMATTQRITDMPSTVKSQASTIMMFYMHESLTLGGLSLEDFVKNSSAIRGRLSFYNTVRSKFYSCQVPFLTPNEALGISYGFGSNRTYPNSGLQRLKLAPSMLNEARLPAYLCRGQSLKGLSKMTSTEAEEGLKPRGLYKFLYSDLYDVATPTEQPVSTTAGEKKPGVQIDSDEQILKDFEALLGINRTGEKPVAKAESKPAPAAPVAPPKIPQALEIEEPKKSRNTPDFDVLVQEFQERYKTSFVNFEWC